LQAMNTPSIRRDAISHAKKGLVTSGLFIFLVGCWG